jgi:hypothetical protein
MMVSSGRRDRPREGIDEMARKLLRDASPLAAAILDGQHDAELELIKQAVAARMRDRFRRGTMVRVHSTRDLRLHGMVGTVMKVNPTRITVGFGEYHETEFGSFFDAEYNIPPNMLETSGFDPTPTPWEDGKLTRG